MKTQSLCTTNPIKRIRLHKGEIWEKGPLSLNIKAWREEEGMHRQVTGGEERKGILDQDGHWRGRAGGKRRRGRRVLTTQENRGAGAGSQMQWEDWSSCLGICCSHSLFTQFCWSHFRYWIQPTIVIASMAKASSYYLWKGWGNNPKRSFCLEPDVPEPPFHRPRGHAGLRAPLTNNHRQDSHLLLDSSLFHAKFSKLHWNSHRVPQRQHTSLLSLGDLEDSVAVESSSLQSREERLMCWWGLGVVGCRHWLGQPPGSR